MRVYVKHSHFMISSFIYLKYNSQVSVLVFQIAKDFVKVFGMLHTKRRDWRALPYTLHLHSGSYKKDYYKTNVMS